MNGDKPIQSTPQTEIGVKSTSLFIPVNLPSPLIQAGLRSKQGFSLAREHEISLGEEIVRFAAQHEHEITVRSHGAVSSHRSGP
jgi:hypothetical protein